MTHNDETRKTIYAKLCAPGAESLRAFCLAHGVTVAAFLDGLSHVLCPLRDSSMHELEKKAPALVAALMTARVIDHDRRSREPRPEAQDNLNGV